MRIAIVAPGSRGDVEPYIALAKGLNKAGHHVRLISHKNFATLVNSQGLVWIKLCPNQPKADVAEKL